jgi:large subunit ribosomal protein L6
MSRIGKQPIVVPQDVEVTLDGQKVFARNRKKGESRCLVLPSIVRCVREQQTQELVIKKTRTKEARSFSGLARTQVANLVKGMSSGFQKSLRLKGIAYRGRLEKVAGNSETADSTILYLEVGYRYAVKLAVPHGLQVNVENSTAITVSGSSKDEVGNFAAKIRSTRPVEPYKGTGIFYETESLRRKTKS